MKDSTYNNDNYFAISNPHLCSCAVASYAIGHSEMHIKVTNEFQKEFYIAFHFVEYYSGPMKWKGANFSIQDRENTVKLLQKINTENYDRLPESYLSNFRLYGINLPDFEIHILAADAEIIGL